MEETIRDGSEKPWRYLTSPRDTKADAHGGEKCAVRLPAGCGQRFLPFQPRHWPNKAALLELHLRGPEPCLELGMDLPEPSRATVPSALKESKHLN